MAVGLEFEKELGDPVIGVDEAGRGPLVGGVYAGAVSVPLAIAEKLLTGEWAAVNDSKKLTERRRADLAEVIKATPGCVWAVAAASAAEIDRLNILRATHLAMSRAVEEVVRQLTLADSSPRNCGLDVPSEQSPNHPITQSNISPSVLVDGLPVKALANSRNLVKGDAKSLFIAAASILAKTTRDADCMRLERLYPGYGFARHKGYPTKAHFEALARLGPCPEHRRSFGPVSQLVLPL